MLLAGACAHGKPKGCCEEANANDPVVAPPAALAKIARLEMVTDQTDSAVALVPAPGRRGALFVVEKTGKIRVLRENVFDQKAFVDVSAEIALTGKPNGEQGLLGLAFHPEFESNGQFFINYTAKADGATHVERWTVDKTDPWRGDVDSRKRLLRIDQPHDNHNAGDLAFGPDGKLYVGLGDGGSGDDPHENGQNKQTLLGSLLRLDVAEEQPSPEVIAIGLRNPWRISFDSQTGALFIADVGQNKFEYVHVVPAADLAPGAPLLNFGWNKMEGFHCFKDRPCEPSLYQAPAMEYDRGVGCSITGGYVYRGKALPALHGNYFYSDYCTAVLRSFQAGPGAKGSAKAIHSYDWKSAWDGDSRLARVSSFGLDHDGELYVVTHEGPIYKLVPAGP